MQKLLLILVSSLLILSCGQNSQKEENQKESTIKNDSEVGNQNLKINSNSFLKNLVHSGNPTSLKMYI